MAGDLRCGKSASAEAGDADRCASCAGVARTRRTSASRDIVSGCSVSCFAAPQGTGDD
jgi:hypothetical protein